MSPSNPNPEPKVKKNAPDPRDASRMETFFYAIGNAENAFMNGLFAVLSTVAFVVLKINPILFGLILAIKTIADAISDPIMAQLTDKTRSRWGRRRPWILIGGVSRQLWLIGMFVFLPFPSNAPTNLQMEQESRAREAALESGASYAEAAEAAEAAIEVSEATDSRIKEAHSDQSADTVALGKSDQLRLKKSEMTEEEKLEALKEISEENPDEVLKTMKKMSFQERIGVGLAVFNDPESAEQRTLVIYLTLAFIGFTIFSTMNWTPYWALGVEIAPSYDGRTRVVAYRSVTDKIAGIVSGWVPILVFLPIFTDAKEGLIWYASLAAAIGIPTTVLCVIKTKERTEVALAKDNPSIFKSIALTIKNWHFVKMIFLHQIIGSANGITAGFLPLILILYVFKGSAVQGTFLAASMSTIQWTLALLCVPLAAWSCKKYQKHITMQFAVIWVSIGFLAKYFCITPDLPYLALILPLFSAFGGTIYYTVLPSMFADITDVDELQNGSRREGMFGAVNAFFGKLNMSTYPILAGIIMTISGFDVDLGADQPAEVFERMIFWASIVPAIAVLSILVFLIRYPWTRERMAEVKATLHERHEARRRELEAEAQSQPSPEAN